MDKGIASWKHGIHFQTLSLASTKCTASALRTTSENLPAICSNPRKVCHLWVPVIQC